MPSRLDTAEWVEPADRAAWRAWLEANHASSSGVWVVTPKASSSRRTLDYEELVRELLCFGWVDSTAGRVDADRSRIYVAPRKRGSTWAATNKARVAELTAQGLMAPAGLAAVEAARADGSWTVLDAVDALEVPADLAAALDADPAARAGYESLPPSGRRQLLWSVVSAKREATRAARVARAVELAREGRAP